jgi:hypothetical protein
VRSQDPEQIREQSRRQGAGPQRERDRLREQEAVGTQERLRDRKRIHTPAASPAGN